MDLLYVGVRVVVCAPVVILASLKKSRYYKLVESDNVKDEFVDYSSKRYLCGNKDFELFRLQPILYLYNHKPYYLPIYFFTSIGTFLLFRKYNPSLYYHLQFFHSAYTIGLSFLFLFFFVS